MRIAREPLPFGAGRRRGKAHRVESLRQRGLRSDSSLEKASACQRGNLRSRGANPQGIRTETISHKGVTSLVRFFCVFTNNPRLRHSPHYEATSSRQLLLSVRDRLHRGATLVNHPLYGNFRPHQQPFRSLVVEETADSRAVDVESLSLIERALSIYGASGPIALPGELDPSIEADYAYVDGELVRESLARCGLEALLSSEGRQTDTEEASS